MTVVIPDVLETEHLADIYKELRKPLAKEAVQKSKKSDTHRGYDTTGYGYQWLIDRLNDVVGIGHRLIERYIEDVYSYKTRNDVEMWSVSVDCTISLGNWVGGQFVTIARSNLCGGHQAKLRSDAQKGAWTNAFKKTAALFGLGADAYRGDMDEDNAEHPDVAAGRQAVKDEIAEGLNLPKTTPEEAAEKAGLSGIRRLQGLFKTHAYPVLKPDLKPPTTANLYATVKAYLQSLGRLEMTPKGLHLSQITEGHLWDLIQRIENNPRGFTDNLMEWYQAQAKEE